MINITTAPIKPFFELVYLQLQIVKIIEITRKVADIQVKISGKQYVDIKIFSTSFIVDPLNEFFNKLLKSSFNNGKKKVINKKIIKMKIQKTLKKATREKLSNNKNGSKVNDEHKIE